ncbi:MAG: hypothetical protein ACK4SA_15775, partial [Caldilinea sp.]
MANFADVDILERIIKAQCLIQKQKRNKLCESRRTVSDAGSVREDMEMSEQELVQTSEVSAPTVAEIPA